MRARLLDSKSLTTSPAIASYQHEHVIKKGLHQLQHHQVRQQVSYAKQLSVGVHNVLLEKLHDAIAKLQYYPEDAADLGQHGGVKVGFVLTPRGDVLQVRVISSSGFHVLDRAAVDTLHRLDPFLLARKYLKRNEYFSLVINFS